MSDGKLVIYNGVSMTADWPAQIEAAQQISHVAINGQIGSRAMIAASSKASSTSWDAMSIAARVAAAR